MVQLQQLVSLKAWVKEMIRKLGKLLTSLFVPKNSVGGGSKTLYGYELDKLNFPIWTNKTVINLPDSDSDKSYKYTAPYSCFLSIYVDINNTVNGALAGIKMGDTMAYINRSATSNSAIGIYLKKGDIADFIYSGKNVKLTVFKLIN